MDFILGCCCHVLEGLGPFWRCWRLVAFGLSFFTEAAVILEIGLKVKVAMCVDVC
jgi:hypothetical protein